MTFLKKILIRVKNLSRTKKSSSNEQDNGSTVHADSVGKAKVPPSGAVTKSPAQGKHNASSITSAPEIDATAHKLVSISGLIENSTQMNVCLMNKGPHLKKGLMATSSVNCKGITANTQADPTGSTVIRRISSASIEDNNSTIPHSTMFSGRVVNQGSRTTSTHSVKDKCAEASPPPTTPTNMSAADAPVQGRSSENDVEPGAAISRLPAKKSHTGFATESNSVPEDEDHRKKDEPNNNDLNEIDVTKIANLDKKSKQTSSRMKPKHHIRWNGLLNLFTDTPGMPLGERCPLCNIDLAFLPKGSDSFSDGVLCSAVLPCSHSYHDSCLQEVFGPYEPQCICCLDV